MSMTLSSETPAECESVRSPGLVTDSHSAGVSAILKKHIDPFLFTSRPRSIFTACFFGVGFRSTRSPRQAYIWRLFLRGDCSFLFLVAIVWAIHGYVLGSMFLCVGSVFLLRSRTVGPVQSANVGKELDQCSSWQRIGPWRHSVLRVVFERLSTRGDDT